LKVNGSLAVQRSKDMNDVTSSCRLGRTSSSRCRLKNDGDCLRANESRVASAERVPPFKSCQFATAQRRERVLRDPIRPVLCGD
jgi:hypothetical protein